MIKSNLRIFIIAFLSIAFLHSCSVKEEKLVIAISKAKPDEYYANYPAWILKTNPNAEIINMYALGVDSALIVLDNCDGLLVTGGADVYPGWYNQLEDTARCGDFDFYRDTLEMELIKKALELKMPLVGICRGEQILNVTLGGSLIIDIPSDHDTIVKHRLADWENCFHDIEIQEGSLLKQICQASDFRVNSNHHQAISRLAKDLKVSAIAEDGIIEAVEWKNSSDKSFMLAVQWHPERLDSVNASLSLPIVKEFIQQAEKYQLQK